MMEGRPYAPPCGAPVGSWWKIPATDCDANMSPTSGIAACLARSGSAACLARLERHPDPAFRAQRKKPDWLDRVAGRESHPIALRDGGDNDLGFRKRKAVADADARPAAERQ